LALLCPSAQPDLKDAVAIGVVGGTPAEPRVRPLERPMPVTSELLQLTEPVRPTEVFRFAAPCLCTGCSHFADSNCRLAAKVVHMLPEVHKRLPECDIRSRCRWFAQEGASACLRCPQIVTDDVNRSAEIRLAADPTTPVPRPDARQLGAAALQTQSRT
jgi:hypothetical protein